MMYRISLSVFAVAFALGGVFLHFCDSDFLYSLCEEDGVVETLSAVLYFAASGLFVAAGRPDRFRNVWCWGFALLFFAVAGEEISWGQRLFGLATPDVLADVNVQREITLHNIEGVHTNIRAIGLLVVFAICFLGPLSNGLNSRARSFFQATRMPVFPLWALGIVVVAVSLMALPRLAFGAVVFELDELGEFLLSLAFCAFAVDAFGQAPLAERPAAAGLKTGASGAS